MADNKTVATEFLARFSTSDIAGALALMTDDATWWIPGKPGSHPSVGQLPKEHIAKLFYRMVKGLKSGLKMTAKGMVAEGNKVAVEAESFGELQNGRIYNQKYHFLMEFREGRICAVREYLDTQHVLDVWFAPEAEGAAR
jgi:ketosteroid isomerase-like protein